MPRRSRFSILLFALSLLPLAGCYKATFVNPTVPPGPVIERWTDFYLYGLVGHEEVDVRLLCPGEVAAIRTGGNVATEIVTGLTFGIYAPRKLYVTCGGAGPSRKPAAARPPAEAPTERKPAPSPSPIAPDASVQASRNQSDYDGVGR